MKLYGQDPRGMFQKTKFLKGCHCYQKGELTLSLKDYLGFWAPALYILKQCEREENLECFLEVTE